MSQRPRIARHVAALPPSGIRRFFDLVQATAGVISLGVGEPDFATPWTISTAAIAGLEAGRTNYTSNAGTLALRREIARLCRRLYAVEFDPEAEILVTVGVSEALDVALRAILEPGDEVLVPEPCFVSYTALVRLAGGVPVPIGTTVESGFVPTIEQLAAACTPRTRAVLIGSPCNPTGTVIPRAVLAQIAELAAERNLFVLSDEIYDRLRYGGEPHTCFSGLPGARERTILLNGFSKAYAMTGWRVGYACGPADVIAAMCKIHQYTLMCASVMGQEAACEALRRGDAAVARMLAAYDERRRLVVSRFRAMGLDCLEPAGAFYAFPSIRRTGLDSQTFCQRLLAAEKVAVVPGSAFGLGGEGHIRATYCAGLDELREALDRIERFVSKTRDATQLS